MRRSIAIAAVLTITGGLAVGSAGPASAASATVITLCRDSQLRAAIAAVPAGGTILFGCDGTIRLDPNKGEIEIHKELTLDANGHTVSISGDHRSQIFIISLRGTVTMRGLTLKDANPPSSPGGGAVFVGGARFVSDHMRFVNNQAGNPENGGDSLAGAGGAISVLGTSGALVVTDSEFVGNSAVCGLSCRAGGGGGAISLRNGGPSLIRRSVFQNNRELGGDGGGAIAATFVSRSSAFYLNGAVTIEFSTFVNNTSNTISDAGAHGVVGGGAVLSLSHPLAIAKSLFTANTADVNLGFLTGIQAAGGAVRSGVSRAPDIPATPGFPTSITDSIFTANAARGLASEGGAVHVDDQPVQISRSTLNGNQANQGSAVRIGGDATTIVDSRLSRNVNTSDLEVGAVWMAGRTTFAGTQLVNNTSGCYLAVFGDHVGEVIDKGNNIEIPGHSCGFRPVGPSTP